MNSWVKVFFSVKKPRYDISGQCFFDFTFSWKGGQWSQTFSNDQNNGQVEIEPGVYAEIYPTYLLDGKEINKQYFPLSFQKPIALKHKDVLSKTIPKLRIEDEKIEDSIKRLSTLLGLPVSLSYCSNPGTYRRRSFR